VRFLRARLTETLLATSPMFASLSDGDRFKLATRFRFLEAEAGQVLVEEGARPPGLFLVAAGRLSVIRRGQLVAQLGPGDLCGEMSLLDGAPTNAAVTTASRAYLLALPAPECREVISMHPEVLAYAHEIAARRKRALREAPQGSS